MKKLTLIFSLACLPFLGMAQDNNAYVSTTIDKVTGKSYTTSSKSIVMKNEAGQLLAINAQQGSTGGLILSFYTKNLTGCVEEKGEINVLFKDGSRISLLNNKDFNCDGEGVVYFDKIYRNKDAFNQLRDKPVATIRFNGSKDYVQADFSEEDQNYFMGVLKSLDPFKKK